jgi:hypothetical protein
MKSHVILLFSTIIFSVQYTQSQTNQPMYAGAWQNLHNSGETICMIDGYFVYSNFNVASKTFNHTWGGPYRSEAGNLKIKIEFDSRDKDRVGKEMVLTMNITSTLVIEGLGEKRTMKQLDDGTGPLAGNWRITGRKQGETMSEIPLRPRRTLKLLTGTRFQWMAINIETGEFSGTGGGTYTFSNGRYTENIEFFSRDSSRVGASLSFDGKVENGEWHHSGLSSKGDPIYEIWTRKW